MIKVGVKEDNIIVIGHAHYAKLGEDIVCSAVSTLFQNLIASLEKLSPIDKIEYTIKEGNSEIKYKSLSERGSLLVDSFLVGIKLISDTFPNNSGNNANNAILAGE